MCSGVGSFPFQFLLLILRRNKKTMKQVYFKLKQMSTDRAEERRGEIFLVFLRKTKNYITALIIVGYFLWILLRQEKEGMLWSDRIFHFTGELICSLVVHPDVTKSFCFVVRKSMWSCLD